MLIETTFCIFFLHFYCLGTISQQLVDLGQKLVDLGIKFRKQETQRYFKDTTFSEFW